MFDFTGYASGYEVSPNKGDFPERSPYCDRDGMFIEEALSAYLDDYIGFADSVLSVENGRIVNPFYRHLNLGYAERLAEADRLKAWYGAIYQVVRGPYDIYSYAKDVNGDHYAIYKKYYLQNPSQSQMRDTLGTMWTRRRNHPIAFPTFDLYRDEDGELTYLQNGKHETTSRSYLGRVDSVQKVHSLVTNGDEFPAGFFDFDFDKTLQNLMLFAPNREFGDIGGYRNCDVVLGKIRPVYDSDTNSWYNEYDKLGNFVQRLENQNIRKSYLQKSWRELAGVYKSQDEVSFIYAAKYMNDDGEDSLYSNTTYDRRNVRYSLELFVEKVNFSDVGKTSYKLQADNLEYNVNDSDFAFEYSGNILTFAYIGRNPMTNNFVVNYVENSNNPFTYDQVSQIVEFDKQLSSPTQVVVPYDKGYVQYDTYGLNFSAFQYEVSSTVITDEKSNNSWNDYVLISRVNDPFLSDQVEIVYTGLAYSEYLISDLYGVAQYPLDVSEGSVGQNDNRFDALQHYLVAVNMQDKNGQLRIVGEPQYYNLNSDATFIPNYPNSAGKMRMWSNDTLSSRLVHSIQMMGKASPYYNDI